MLGIARYYISVFGSGICVFIDPGMEGNMEQERTDTRIFYRGEIYDIGELEITGSEQQGCRPVLIVSCDEFNEYSPEVVIVFITSQLEKMGERFDTVLYTMPGAKPIAGVSNLGIADYTTKMPLVFRRSKINLNITLRSIISGVPLRVMDILAAGGFLITTYQKEIEEYFEDGKELVIARTPEEMLELTAYYLEHEDERKEIAAAGQKKVYEEFAYTKLLPKILGDY